MQQVECKLSVILSLLSFIFCCSISSVLLFYQMFKFKWLPLDVLFCYIRLLPLWPVLYPVAITKTVHIFISLNELSLSRFVCWCVSAFCFDKSLFIHLLIHIPLDSIVL